MSKGCQKQVKALYYSWWKYDIKNELYNLYSLYSDFTQQTKQHINDKNTVLGINMSNYYKYYKMKTEIKILDHLYKFKFSFFYSIIKDEDGFIAENEYFNIFCYGDTAIEAERELYEYVNKLWESYVEEDDENLDESGIKLKAKLLESIRKIY